MKEAAFNDRFADAIRSVTGWDDCWVIKDTENAGLVIEDRRSPDLLLTLPNSLPIVAECKFYEGAGNPIGDARKYLGLTLSGSSNGAVNRTGTLSISVAVYYPPGANQWIEQEVATRFADGKEKLRWKFISGNSSDDNAIFPENGWLSGDISDFADSVTKTVSDAKTIDSAANMTAKHIMSAAASLDDELGNYPNEKQRISALMGSSDNIGTGLQVACLVWFDSLLILNELGRNTPQFGSTESCRDESCSIVPMSVKEEWGKVLAVNYDSVFRPAYDAFPRVLHPDSHRNTFTLLVDAVDKAERYLLGETASLAGEIFARVMDAGQRKNSAAFYTRPEVAEYLTYLTLPDQRELSDVWEDWKIADFACGTGTLLRSGYRRLKQFAASQQVPLDDYHRGMIEQGLCGVDITPIAIHLTAASIVSLRPEVGYHPANIGLAKIGGSRGGSSTGAVELLDESGTRLFTDNYTIQKGTEDRQDAFVLTAEDGSFDAVLMNPPYSRTGGGQKLFDLSGVSDEYRQAAQKRVWKLAKGTCGDGKAGIASVFAAIGDRKLKEGKRMGLVLPLTCAAAGSWQKFRDMMSDRYTDLTVTSFSRGVQGGDYSLSADTYLGEVLVTARKSKSGREGIAYVSIDNLFGSAVEASESARSLHNTLSGVRSGDMGVLNVGDDRVGSWYVAPRSRVWGGAGAVGLLGLVPAAELLTEGKVRTASGSIVARFPVASMSDLFDVGPSHHSIGHNSGSHPIGAFTFYPIDSDDAVRGSSYVALWATDHKSQAEILVEPTHYGIEYADCGKVTAQLGKRTDLFHKKNMRWTSNTALVAASKEKILGGAAWAGLRPCRDDDGMLANWNMVRYAMAVWSNSVFGFVSFWLQGQRQKSGRSEAQLYDICQLMIPDFRTVGFLERVRQVRKQFGTDLFGLLLMPANRAHIDPNRRVLDYAAGLLLGLDKYTSEDVVVYLADQWTSEPSVSSR